MLVYVAFEKFSHCCFKGCKVLKLATILTFSTLLTYSTLFSIYVQDEPFGGDGGHWRRWRQRLCVGGGAASVSAAGQQQQQGRRRRRLLRRSRVPCISTYSHLQSLPSAQCLPSLPPSSPSPLLSFPIFNSFPPKLVNNLAQPNWLNRIEPVSRRKFCVVRRKF